MFGKDQPEIVTEEDVGNYITELHRTTIQPIDEVLDDSNMAGNSKAPTTWTQGKN